MTTRDNNINIKNLAFEGGGIHGIAYGGVILALDEAGLLSGIERVVGTSSGSICAALLALNIKPVKLVSILSHMDFASFADNSNFVIADVYRLFTQYGWNKGKVFTSWLGDQIESVGLSRNITLAELHAAKIGPDLHVVGTSLTQGRSVVFSHTSHPSMSVVDAVRISTSFPIFFTPVKVDGSLYADGGLLDSFPVRTFDASVTEVNPNTVGFRLNTHAESLEENLGYANYKIGSLKDLVTILLSSLNSALQRSHMRQADWDRTVTVIVPNSSSMNFHVTDGEIRELIASGYHSTVAYLCPEQGQDQEQPIQPKN